MFGNFKVTELTSFKDVDTCPLRPAKYEKKPNCIFLVQKSARTPHQKLQIQVPLLCNKQTFVLRSGTTLSAKRSRCVEDILAARFICNHHSLSWLRDKMMYIKTNRLLTLTNSRYHG